MTKKTKSRIIAALALTTALSAPALIMPLVTAPPALAGEATHDWQGAVGHGRVHASVF